MATIPYEELSLVKSLKVLTIDPALLSVTISLKWVNLFQANISFLYPLYSFVSLLAWGTDFQKKKAAWREGVISHWEVMIRTWGRILLKGRWVNMSQFNFLNHKSILKIQEHHEVSPTIMGYTALWENWTNILQRYKILGRQKK